MPEPPVGRDEPQPETIPADLSELRRQIVAARAELEALHRQIADARRSLDGRLALHLREANEHLILAALKAQEGMDTARGDLDLMTRASQRDSLTGLPNRSLMRDRIESAIQLAKRRNTRLAILFVDLDGFKQVNDSRGHATGDSVLGVVAACLRNALRASDTVSRHGGDEFLVLLTEVAVPEDAGQVASNILAALARPGSFGDPTLRVTASIGISVFPEDALDAAMLIDLADTAMYRAKHLGGNRLNFHGVVDAS